MWGRASGRPVHNASVWQDRRSAPACAKLVEEGRAEAVRAATGLVIDPYFSATKVAWLLDNVARARRGAERGEIAFGTIDSFLLWRLTGGRVHATDATNASRTMLFDIHRQEWDDELLALFGVPRAVLPEVRDSSGEFGEADPEWLGAAIPICSALRTTRSLMVTIRLARKSRWPSWVNNLTRLSSVSTLFAATKRMPPWVHNDSIFSTSPELG
ncbi:MAG: hypothetical protein IH835_05755, partial [Proteobacteria bacterium]|nr:hypothetical protein [Pseudomonadota bacterium]